MLEHIRCLGAVDPVYPGTPQFYTAFPNPSSSSLALPQVQGQTRGVGGADLEPVEGSFGEDPTRWGRVLGVGAPVWPTNRRG